MSARSANISVVIPTHNRARALEETLRELSRVERAPSVRCEVIVVANGCTDRTVMLVKRMAAEYPLRLRCVEEEQASLNIARNLGAHVAEGTVVAFLDDDVSVHRGWLQALVEALASRAADLVAGRVTLAWEERVPPWIGPEVEQLLSKLDLGEEILELDTPRLVGANFAVRRSILEELRFQPELDRAGRHLLSGGDTELAARAMRRGHRLYYVPGVHVEHRIPGSRLDLRYLSRLAYGRGRTRVLIAELGGEPHSWRLLRLGCSQVARGIARQVASRLTGEERGVVTGRLLRMRGLGLSMGELATAWRRLRGRTSATRFGKAPAGKAGAGSRQHSTRG